MSSTHGCATWGPLELSKWWGPALECLGRRPDFYTVVCVESLESGARLVLGASDTPLILCRARGHFAPMWCSNASALAAHLISTRTLPFWRTLFGWGVRGTCHCCARFRSSESQADMQMCQKCLGKYRRYCACGAQFRPPANDAGLAKCSKCREAAASAMDRNATEEAKDKCRDRKATEDEKANGRDRNATEAANAQRRDRKSTEEEKANRRDRNATEEAKTQRRDRKATEEEKAKCRDRHATEEANAQCRDRNATEDALIGSNRRRAEVGRRPAVEDVGKAPCGAESAPNGEGRKVPEQKIRDVHGVGPLDRGVLIDSAHANRRWTPSCYADLADERKVGIARELRDFLEGMRPATCDVCMSRWFSASYDIPAREDSGNSPPESLRKLRTPKAPCNEGHRL